MKINDLYDTDHDKTLAENIVQKCQIINQLHAALVEKEAEIKELKTQLEGANAIAETTNSDST